MDQALKHLSANVYTLETNSAWIFAGGMDIWIVNSEYGLRLAVYDTKKEEIVDEVCFNKENGK